MPRPQPPPPLNMWTPPRACLRFSCSSLSSRSQLHGCRISAVPCRNRCRQDAGAHSPRSHMLSLCNQSWLCTLQRSERLSLLLYHITATDPDLPGCLEIKLNMITCGRAMGCITHARHWMIEALASRFHSLIGKQWETGEKSELNSTALWEDEWLWPCVSHRDFGEPVYSWTRICLWLNFCPTSANSLCSFIFLFYLTEKKQYFRIK